MKHKLTIFSLAWTLLFEAMAPRGSCFLRELGASANRGLRSASLSGRRLHLDARLLSIRRLRLVLGAGRLGSPSLSGSAVDSGLLSV